VSPFVLETVVNVSEGRDDNVLTTLREACGPSLIDVHTDADHNRSVFTLAGPGPDDAAPATRALARAVAENVSIAAHSGVHPRLGALDVVPFVALCDDTNARDDAVAYAHEFASWWSIEFAVPVFFYGDADREGRDLPSARRNAFATRRPDLGPASPHATLGATTVGARPPLVAINCLLTTDDIRIAVDIARHTRERDGGLPGVRALGFPLARAARAQVSLNVTDLARTGVETACEHVRTLARTRGVEVSAVELVGLLPAAELARCSPKFRAWSRLDDDCTIEARIGASGRRGA
jgi:glutamate formiminotransferase / 5-formyltetrahydrofolate cyclo-ligase